MLLVRGGGRGGGECGLGMDIFKKLSGGSNWLPGLGTTGELGAGTGATQELPREAGSGYQGRIGRNDVKGGNPKD